MASTIPPPHCLAFLCIYSYALMHCVHLAYGFSFAFNFSTIATNPCGNDLQCQGDASFASQMIELTKTDISRDSKNSQGRMWYASPVPLRDAATAEVASFTTTFSFEITPDKNYKNDDSIYNIRDGGMAFFLAPYSTSVLRSGGGGGTHGLFNDSNMFSSSVIAVEFDTYKNWVSININSIRSKASTNTSVAGNKVINLGSNVPMTARIDYDNRTKILAVDLDVNGSWYHVNDTVDLELLLTEKVTVGLSAATSLFYQLHGISFWSFHSSLEEKVTPHASASPQQIPYPSNSFLIPIVEENKAVPPASAPSQKIPYPSIAMPPAKPGSSAKYSAATGSSAELHRISYSSSRSSLDEKAVSPTTAPSPKILEPSTKCCTATGLCTELRRVLVAQEASPRLPPEASPSPAPADAVSSPAPVVELSPSLPPDAADVSFPVPSEKQASLHLQVVAPILAVLVCVTVGPLLCLWQKCKRHDQPNKVGTTGSESDEQPIEADFERGVAGPRRYHYHELATATRDFKDEKRLGRGGFGSVYQGTLQGDSNKQVAVKKFSSETSSQGRKEFEAEVKIISRLRHRNLVQLLGWCDSAKGLLLVYELVPEGSLDKHIHNNTRLLTWSERYKIIMGLGSALRYLHGEWDQCVVHGDIKPSNIMLDASYNTKLGDFGLARLADHGANPRTTMNVLGTAGYIDPDFVNTRRPSTESDVYSFGIVLLEIVSGNPPIVQNPPFVLLRWVWSLYSQGKIMEAVDTRLWGHDADERQMERALVVGLWCAHHDPAQRPSIVDAMCVLQSDDAKLPVLPPHMYKMAAMPSVITMSESGASGSSFSSGVRSSATTGTTRSSDSFTH